MIFVGRYRNGIGLGGAISNLSTPLRVWSEKQVRVLRGAFNVGGHQDHGGSPWPRAKDPTDIKVMVGSGRLMNSIQAGVSPKGARIFTPVSYAVYPQEGRGVPKREIIVVTKQDTAGLEAIIKAHIEEQING